MSNQYDTSIKAGTRFGRLTFVQRVAGKKSGLKTTGQSLCLCDCGNSFIARTNNLKIGDCKSCGCLKTELGIAVETHRKSRSKEFQIWCSMKARCLYESATGYENYGGRGIQVCDRWLNSFEDFMEDMGPMPTPQHSIERKDVNGNYEPSNCIWLPKSEQASNTRRNRKLTFNGETLTVFQWARKTGISRPTISSRVNILGWTTEMALTRTPINPYPRNTV